MRQAKDLISILEEAHQVVPEELIEMANMAKNHMSSMYKCSNTYITIFIVLFGSDSKLIEFITET